MTGGPLDGEPWFVRAPVLAVLAIAAAVDKLKNIFKRRG